MGRYLVELAMRAKHKLLVMQVCDECYTKNHLSFTGMFFYGKMIIVTI
nr:MAG TPA: hypothetical protein [Caudoviricetes sp.]DAV79752.1 MAG TPA: hypothetical protein [Caudoviricetes sp.]